MTHSPGREKAPTSPNGGTRHYKTGGGSDHIRIDAICPVSIDTSMLRNPIERRGRDPQEVDNRLSLIDRFWYTPEGIASAALWLCSSAWGFTIGHALAVNSGYLSR